MLKISKLKKRACQLTSVLRGFAYKWRHDMLGDKGNVSLSANKSNKISKPQIIVSLTSYGRRVKDTLPYTIMSILEQTQIPDRVIVWLDFNNWNDENLPPKIKKLKEKGVEIRYCEDLRSYKKLIPSLKAFPEDIIITFDDDIIYHKDIIESLVKAHDLYPTEIICRVCRFPLISNQGIAPYTVWTPPFLTPDRIDAIMPLGGSGCLYPPYSFDDEVFNQKIFQSLCPTADDIWFWVMAKRNGTNHRVIAQSRTFGNSFDDLYQYFHKGAALTHTNSKKNANDEQLECLMNHYNISTEDLMNCLY